MSTERKTTGSRRRLGLLELIGLLATIIPCCLATFAFLGVERLPGLVSSAPQPAPTQVTVASATPSSWAAAPPKTAPQPSPPSGAFDVAGSWAGQFDDAGFSEISDYVLELSRSGNSLSGTATAIAPGNPNCRSSHPVRGHVEVATQTMLLKETVGGVATCPTFPRGSAGDIKTFTLAYDASDGVPALRGTWQKVYSSSWDAPGEIVFYRQP